MNPRTVGLDGVASVPGPPVGDPVRTVFLGSGVFGVPALRRLAEHPAVQLVGVVTAPARPVGRRQVLTSTPIGALAAELGLAPVLTPARLRAPESIAEILALAPGLAVLADYGQIVPPALLDLPHGALNLHPSALPRWRGAAPIPATILAGDRETAVTLMRMDAGLDTGPVVARVEVPLTGDERPRTWRRAWPGSPRSCWPAAWDPGCVASCRPCRSPPTASSSPGRCAGRMDAWIRRCRPSPSSARCGPTCPGRATFLEVDGQRLVVSAASIGPSEPGDIPGTLVRLGERPALATVDGRLVLHRVTPEGKRPMTGEDWLRGRRDRG